MASLTEIPAPYCLAYSQKPPITFLIHLEVPHTGAPARRLHQFDTSDTSQECVHDEQSAFMNCRAGSPLGPIRARNPTAEATSV